MNTQHTSGPWWIGHGTLSIYSAEGRIADLKQSANDDQDEADARLIAAAPDLLEALKQLVSVAIGTEHGREFKHQVDIGIASIAKAKGE